MITSIDPNLLDIAHKELYASGEFPNEQVILPNFILNICNLCILECLHVKDWIIIDGFVRTAHSCYPYKGKSFFELLGNKHGVASPIDITNL